MGRQEPQEKCPLHAWLSFWGCPHRQNTGEAGSLAGWMGSTLHPISLCSVCLCALSRASELRRVGGADGGGWAPSPGP